MKSFGQKAPLTTTLRNVLRDYGSAQLLDEQLQNADDAGATECAVVLDVQEYCTQKIATSELASWQGAALCFYDDAEFTSLDFESIQLVGDGKKRGDPTKTGQFGLGFNSAYHVTDVPMFLTRSKLVVFDPHCEHGLNGPGAMFEDLSELTDQMAPFDFVSRLCSGLERGTGTIFRFPLRKVGSKIKKEPTCPEDCWREVVEPFMQNMSRRLLFLKHMKKIRVFRGCELVATATSRGGSQTFWQAVKNVVASESYEKAMTKKKMRDKIPKLLDHRLALSDGRDDEDWLIVTAFGDDADVARGLKLNLMPYAAVAVPLSAPAKEMTGLVYASLPTPVRTGLPVHVDGRFEVTRDRNALRVSRAPTSKGGKDEAVQRADWNTRVMSKVVAEAYVRAVQLVDRCILPDWVWADDSAFGASVSNHVYDTLVRTNAPVFDGKPARDVLFDDARAANRNDVVICLRQAGCPIVASPAPYNKTVGKALGKIDRLLSPTTTAAWLRKTRPQLSPDSALLVIEYLAPLATDATAENPLYGLPIVPVMSSKVVDYNEDSLLVMDNQQLGSLLTPALQDRIVDSRCARFLASQKVLEAADVVEANLPSDWRGRPSVTTASPKTMAWIREFWAKVPYKKIKGTACCEWPLLPCAGGEVVALSRIGIVMLPSNKDDDNDLAIAALTALGVMVADLDALESWTELSDDAAKLSASAVVEATVRLSPNQQTWDAIGSEARDALLAAIATTECDEATAEKLATLPLFAYASTRQRRPMPPARDERYFENDAADDDLLASSSEMLAKPRDASVRSLYERLGAREGTVVAFWLARLDDRWQHLDVPDRIRLLKQLRRDLEVACDSPLPTSFGSQSFADWLGSKPLLWTRANTFIAIKDALDPREPLNVEFWPDRLVPSDDLPLDEWLPFLLRAGMTPGISKISILRAARIADTEQSLDRARLVVSALFHHTVVATEDTEWLQELGRLRIAEPRYTLPGKKTRLVTFAGNVLPVVGSQREHASCWSQRTVVSSGGSTPRVTTIRGLGAVPNASLEDVAKHLLYLTNNASSLETLFQASDRLSLRDQIGCCYDSLGYLVTATTTDTGGSRTLLDLTRDAPICMLRGRQRAFARPSRIFPALNGDEDAPPFLYSLDERADDDLVSSIARYPRLKEALGIPKGKPTLQRLEELSAELDGERLDEDNERGIKAAAQLARLAFKYHHADENRITMYLPDASGLCRLATDTVYDDAPWLEDRVDKRTLPLVHPSLERKVVEALGSEPMSTAVTELPGEVVVGDASRDARLVLDAWQTTLRSPAFVASLRRASTAARIGGKQQPIDTARLTKIRKAQLVPATTLRSRFVYRESVDCSAGKSSSPALILDKGEDILIYVLVDEGRPGWRRRWRASVATALDRYLDRAVGDRALIGELLSVEDVDEMAHVLDAYEIPSLELDMRLGSTPAGLEDDDHKELAPLEDPPRVGDVVVCNGINVKIIELSPNANDALVATNPDLSEIESVPRDSLRRVVRKQPQQAVAPSFDSENERKAREAIVRREENAVLDPEPAGIDDIAYEQLANGVDDVAAIGGSTVTKKTRVSPGFDLVRVGTFGKSDVIFFHHRMTLAELYDENRHRRQRLVKECCCVLDDVAGVFGYDPAKVALFYQQGVVSRFVSQKLYFNLAPVEARKQGDARTDAFTYCYFWGLFVHKLSHFFDIVHGTRHDFFQTEYRSHFALNFIALLLARGFDPAKVENEFGDLIHQEVF